MLPAVAPTRPARRVRRVARGDGGSGSLPLTFLRPSYQQREFIANLAIARRLLLSVWSRETWEAGSCHIELTSLRCVAVPFVDKILKGAEPGDLPVEEPSKIEFLVNLRTAKALGLTFPKTLLVAATDVIE
jgi:putative ABC transport system substrate-binding protein